MRAWGSRRAWAWCWCVCLRSYAVYVWVDGPLCFHDIKFSVRYISQTLLFFYAFLFSRSHRCLYAGIEYWNIDVFSYRAEEKAFLWSPCTIAIASSSPGWWFGIRFSPFFFFWVSWGADDDNNDDRNRHVSNLSVLYYYEMDLGVFWKAHARSFNLISFRAEWKIKLTRNEVSFFLSSLLLCCCWTINDSTILSMCRWSDVIRRCHPLLLGRAHHCFGHTSSYGDFLMARWAERDTLRHMYCATLTQPAGSRPGIDIFFHSYAKWNRRSIYFRMKA